MKEIIANPYYAGIILFLTQFIYIYLRTVNIIHTAEKRMVASVVTGIGIGITWLVSTAIGISAVMDGDWLLITIFLLGGGLGTFLGIKRQLNR